MTPPPPDAKPLPCPWCGLEPAIVTYAGNHAIHAIECRNPGCVICAETFQYVTPAEAIAAWNTRANTEAK